MKRFLLLAAALLAPISGLLAQSATVSITPSSTTYSTGGGTITFVVDVSYDVAQSDLTVLGLQISGVPANWSYGLTTGLNVPQVKPAKGDTGAFGFTYFDFPETPASFAFTVEYPAGLSGAQTFSGIVSLFKKTGDATTTQTPLPNIVLNSNASLPVITAHPATVAAFSTQNVSFSVTATSGTALTYQWNRNGVPLSGQTSTTLALNNITTANNGTYTVDVTNATGTTVSRSATLTVTTSSVPAISGHPSGATVNPGASVTFTGTASGVPAPAFQWTKDGVDVPGATSNSLTISSVIGANAGAYRLVATNFRGSATSNPATLTVNPGIGSFTPASAGQTAVVTINGAGFTGASAVRFNNVMAASFTVVSDSQITAVVPTLGTTGAITVTRSDSSVLTSATNFTVLQDPRLAVVSRTGRVDANARLIVGTFTVEGTGPKKFLLRGVGPAMGGDASILADPFLAIVDSTGAIVATNDNWGTSTNLAEIQAASAAVGAFPEFTNTASNDAALLVSLNPGTYSARLSGGPTASVGYGGLEIYDVQDAPRLSYVSSYGQVVSGSPVMTSFTLTLPSGTGRKTVLIRALGAGALGITGAIANPTLSLVDSASNTTTNDNFGTNSNLTDLNAATALVGAMPLGTNDSALLVSLLPGSYIINVASADGTSAGTVATELFLVDGYRPNSFAPSLIANIREQSAVVGSSVTFAAPYVAKPEPSFQWRKNGTNIPSATNKTLTLSNVTNADAAAYSVVLSNGVAPDAVSHSANLVITKALQTITFGTLANVTFGGSSFTLGATSSSGLAVSYSSSNTAVASISGNVVTIGNAGSAIITASQSGDADYEAAPNVTQTLTVNKAAGTVTLASLSATFDGSPKAATATTTPAGLTVVFTYDGSGTAPTVAGSYTVVGTINDTNYAGSATGTLVIGKASQTITFDPLAARTFGDVPFTLGATASSGHAVEYASSNTNVATVSGNSVTIVGAGSTTITASQPGTVNFSAATSVTQTLTVNKATAGVTLGSLSATFDGSAKAATATTSPSGLSVVFTYDGSGTAPTNAGSYAVVGTINDNNFTGSANGTLVIAKANQTITFGAIGQKVFTDGSVTLAATASSGLAVSYTSSDTGIATVSGSTVSFVTTGTVTITAHQAGNSNYNAAPPVDQSLQIVPALQTITFDVLAAKTFGDAPFTLTASASSSLTVSFASSDTGVATVSGNTVTIVGAGTTTITASQAGNANFGPAPDVPRTLTVNKAAASVTLGALAATYDGSAKAVTATTSPAGLNVTITYAGSGTAPTNAGTYAVVATINEANYAGSATGDLVIAKADQTISFATLASKTFGDAPFDLTATASSGLTVAFASSDSAIASISGVTVTILAGGSPTITATQAGNANYNAAPPVARTLTINKAAATVALANLTHTYNGSVKNATATTTPSGLTVVFTYAGTASPSTAPHLAGDYAVTGTISDNRYQGSASGTLTINKADQVISFAALPSRPLDEGNFALTATSDSGLAVSYATSNPSSGTVATISGSTVTLVNTGTITITASQAGDANYNPATSVDQVLTVLNQSQTLTFAQAQLPTKTFGNAPFAITGTSNRGLLISFASSNTSVATVGTGTLTGNDTTATVTIVGAGTADITASQAGDSNTAAATNVVRTLTVNQAPATINLDLATLSATYDGSPKSASATTTPTGLNVVFTYTPTGGSPTGTPPTNAGSYAVAATVVEANYTGAASGTLVIAKAPQAITFPAIPIKLIDNGAFTLEATADSGLAVSYTSSNTAVATVNGSTVAVLGLGNSTITAMQAGNTNYLAATNVTRVLTVNPVAPVFVSTPSTTVTAVVGSSFLFGPVTLNPLSAPATFSMTGNPPGLVVNATSGNISGIPTGAPGSFTIILTATNATNSATRTINLTLQPAAPVIQSPAAASAIAGSSFTYNTNAPNATSYSATGLPAGLVLDTGTGVISGTPTTAGTFTVQLTATNTTGSVTLPLVITVALPPDAPVYSGLHNPSGTAGAAFSFTPNFGTSASATTYAITAGTLPTGLNLNTGTGVISGNTTQVGSFPITLSATRVGITASVDLVVTINPAATAPVIGYPNGSTVAGTVGSAFPTFAISATPSAGATFSSTALPAGLSLNATTGAITGTPTTPGTTEVMIFATNSAGQGPTGAVVITINPHASAPVITSSPIVQGRVGDAFTYTLTASPAIATTYANTGALPNGLSLTNGVVSGTPTTVGTLSVFFVGSNANGPGLAMEVIFNIAPPLTVPVVNSNGTASGQVGQLFNYTITASNSPNAFAASGLPAGLTVNTSTGLISGVPSTATLSGTPATVSLTASNGDGTSNPKPLLITIASAPATPVITSGAGVSGRVGTALTYQITASETPTSFVATDLPPGLGVNPTTGAITGTPTESGTFTATIRAANAAGLGAPSSLGITIAAPLTAPAITSAASATGQVGTAFSYLIVASQTATSFSAAGALPLGLALNSSTGAITGSPAEAGVFTVNLTATGISGTSLPQPLTIVINPAVGVPVITSATTAAATVGGSFNYTITATNVPAAPFPPAVTLDAVHLPAGLAVNPSTGVIQGVPTTVGTTVASLVGTNEAGTGPARALTINVQPALTAPVVTSGATASAQVGTNFSYTIVATNTPTSFEVLGSPAWMTINSSTGTLAGTPAVPGTIQVQLVAANSAGLSSPKLLTITVAAAAGTPVITSSHSTTGQVSSLFASYQITTAPAATSYLATGLPSGLVLNSTTGVISGTPSVSGTFNVTLSASNATGVGAPVTLVITIQPNAQLVVPGS